MRFNELKLKGVYEIILSGYDDERGTFMRLFDQDEFAKQGLPGVWVQENRSFNRKKHILRGLHFILPPHTDGKLIKCTRGEIWDVIVDLRKDSKTKGQYIFNVLKENDHKWIYIPKGFAHGYLTLTDNSEIIYKHDTFYNASYDSGINWSDEELKIEWPHMAPLVSKKDTELMSYSAFLNKYGGL